MSNCKHWDHPMGDEVVDQPPAPRPEAVELTQQVRLAAQWVLSGVVGDGLPEEPHPRTALERPAGAKRPVHLDELVFESFSCFEGRILASRDLDLFGCPRLDAGTGTALSDLEGAEAGDLHFIADG
jgi:hypothetical protein